jgi:hypothetical protein
MAIYRGPNIVRNGLVLTVDAADRNSYIGSGSTWSDLSGNNNNGTLVNTPTFSDLNKGSIVFNGSNQYVNIANSTSLQVTATFTVCAWIYATTLAARYGIFSTRAVNPAGSWQFEVGVANAGTNRMALTGVGTWIAETVDNVISANVWRYVCVVKVNNATTGATMYVNGSSVSNRVTTAYTISNNADVKRIASGSNTLELFPGRIAQTSLYNRALSAAEILQNYNASKTRFGL